LTHVCVGSALAHECANGRHFPIVIVHLEDLRASSDSDQFEKGIGEFSEAAQSLEEHVGRSLLLTIVFLGESMTLFSEAKWLIPAVSAAINDAHICVFAAGSELSQIGTVFGRPKQDMPVLTRYSLAPFPRLHCCTFATALGETLEEHECIGVALTVVPDGGNSVSEQFGSGLPRDKFAACKSRWSPFALSDSRCEAKVERIVLGGSGGASASLIMPAKLLTRLLDGMLEGVLPTEEEERGQSGVPQWQALGFEAGRDDFDLMEHVSNLEDFRSKLERYAQLDGFRAPIHEYLS